MTDEGPAPPAVGVNVNVAETPDLPATRSSAAMTNVTESTAPPIAPEAAEADTFGSALVFIETAIELVVALPIVKPLIVTANAASVLMVAPEIVSVIAVSLVVELMILKPGTLLASAVTKGVTKRAKKLGGYISVMVPPGGMS